jgi:hypothetical protein
MPPSKTLHLDEDAVADMIVDDEGLPDRWRSSGPGDRAKKFREEKEKNRRERREKGARRSEKIATLAPGEDVFFDFSTQDTLQSHQSHHPDNLTPDIVGKRKGVFSAFFFAFG